jgi:hypothetical protein
MTPPHTGTITNTRTKTNTPTVTYTRTVTNTRTATLTPTVTLTRTVTNTPVFTLTPVPACVAGGSTASGLDLQVSCTGQTEQEIRYSIRVTNNGGADYVLGDLCLKLWVYESGPMNVPSWEGGLGRVYDAQNHDVGMVDGTASGSRVALPVPCTGIVGHYANQEMTVCFHSGQAIPRNGGYWLGQSNALKISRIPNMDNRDFADDYSHLDACSGAFVDSPYFALYSNGKLVWKRSREGPWTP